MSAAITDDETGGGRSKGTAAEQWTLDDASIHPNISNHLKNVVPEEFYGRDVWGETGQVLEEWTGIMGYTVDAQPVVGEAPGEKGLWICAGFNGHGKHTSCDLGALLTMNRRHGSNLRVRRGACTNDDGSAQRS